MAAWAAAIATWMEDRSCVDMGAVKRRVVGSFSGWRYYVAMELLRFVS